jgi:hypothetical protein
MGFFVVSSFCAIRLSHAVEYMVFAVLVFSASATLFQLSIVSIVVSRKNEMSVKVLEDAFPKLIKDEDQIFGKGNLWNRELISLESLKCWIGNMYYMKKRTKLIFIGFIMNLLVSFLVAF